MPGKGSLPWDGTGKALRTLVLNKGVVMEPFVKMGGKVAKDIKVWRDVSRGAGPEQMDKDIK